MTKGLPPLRIQNLSKKVLEKDYEIKNKPYTANRNWNYRRFQLHWNKLEWFNPRIKITRKNPIQFLQRDFL